jgi:hypothetical protein
VVLKAKYEATFFLFSALSWGFSVEEVQKVPSKSDLSKWLYNKILNCWPILDLKEFFQKMHRK